MALNQMGFGMGPIFSRTDSGISNTGMGPIFRTDSGLCYRDSNMERRQLFLRSYQFSRKISTSDRIKQSLVRMKRVLWVRLRSAKKLRKAVWFRLRHGLFYGIRRKRFTLLHNNYGYRYYNGYKSSSNCYW